MKSRTKTIVKVKKYSYSFKSKRNELTREIRYNTNLKMKKLIKLCFEMEMPFAVSIRTDNDIINNFNYIEIIVDSVNYNDLIDYLERNKESRS